MWGRILSKIELAVLSEYQDTLSELADAVHATRTIYIEGSANEFEAQWLTY